VFGEAILLEKRLDAVLEVLQVRITAFRRPQSVIDETDLPKLCEQVLQSFALKAEVLLEPGAAESDEAETERPDGFPDKLLEVNDAFFGTPAWRNAWHQTAHDTELSRQALLQVYLDQIAPMYDFPPQHILVETRSGSPQYYLIFFTNKNLGDKVFQTAKKAVETYQKERWVRENMKIKLSLESFGPGGERLSRRSLDDYL